MTTTNTPQQAPGIIDPKALYTLPALRRELGWGSHTMRRARRAGLPVRYEGSRAYAIGEDVVAYIRENGRLSR